MISPYGSDLRHVFRLRDVTVHASVVQYSGVRTSLHAEAAEFLRIELDGLPIFFGAFGTSGRRGSSAPRTSPLSSWHGGQPARLLISARSHRRSSRPITATSVDTCSISNRRRQTQ